MMIIWSKMEVGDKVEIKDVVIFAKGIRIGDKASIVDFEPNGYINIFLESGERKGDYQICEAKDIKLI